jgi:hypothetical protein
MSDTQPAPTPDPSSLIPPDETFIVLRVDPDGSAQLLDPRMRQHADAEGTAFWCRPNQPLQQGQRVQGILEFHPRKAVAHKRMPHFTVNVVLESET